MTAYDKMVISGNLKADYGPTTVGTYSGATSSGLGWTDNLTSYCGPFNKGLGTFTGDTEVIANGVFNESVYRSAPAFDLDIDGITIIA